MRELRALRKRRRRDAGDAIGVEVQVLQVREEGDLEGEYVQLVVRQVEQGQLGEVVDVAQGKRN